MVKAEQQTSSAAVRRPEDSARAAHFAYALHASMAKPRARLPWKARAMTEGADLAHLEDRIRHRVVAAMARATAEEARAKLVELAAGRGFAHLDARVQAMALDTLADGPIDLALATDADLALDDIAPGQVGYRPKLQAPGASFADFLVWHDRRYVHLGGIESPGLTASLAIARRVASML